jgi:hypothetical protein
MGRGGSIAAHSRASHFWIKFTLGPSVCRRVQYSPSLIRPKKARYKSPRERERERKSLIFLLREPGRLLQRDSRRRNGWESAQPQLTSANSLHASFPTSMADPARASLAMAALALLDHKTLPTTRTQLPLPTIYRSPRCLPPMILHRRQWRRHAAPCGSSS